MPSLEEAANALIRDGSWYLGDSGLVIFSDLYEMGPYAAGILEFELGYESLGGYIKAEYMREASDKTASFSVVPAEKLSESSKEIIDMVKLDEAGQAIYLVAEGSARNVRLTAVDYTDAFYETGCLWYCSEMNDCAVQLLTNIPEGMPDLKLSYVDSNGEHELYLSQSGEDGSFILVDGSIEAVG